MLVRVVGIGHAGNIPMEVLLSRLWMPTASPQGYHFDPYADVLQAPAKHAEIALPRVLTMPIDSYVYVRDREVLAGKVSDIEPRPFHRRALRNFAIYTIPGWGNFTFGASFLNLARATSGDGLTHVSVSEEGPLWKRGAHTMIGLPRVSVAPEWIHEFPTVIYRVWYSLQVNRHFEGALPERELFLGHSKGGLLTYLLACLARSHRDNRLDDFMRRLTDSQGNPVLKDVPRDLLVEVAQKLSDSVFGALGSPLYGIDAEFARIADFGVGPVGFNALTGDSAKYFAPEYLRELHRKTGYRPNEVLDFVMTSELGEFPRGWEAFKKGAGAFTSVIRNPLIGGKNVLFRGGSRLLVSGIPHDGVAPSQYPESFEHRLHLVGPSHTDQVEDPQVLLKIFDFLVARGLATKN